ncbi:subclass B1 metallo-beta-lactamase [Zhouia spongiae]|uniref:beta-lactamase n=1 Tax=Zhouia spongiae TaxID=2202721 RepID=A0ABY3YMM3_9FLAO|nr:subclass B1 metallo-beta-lactamase [Zhouia spongiae]UNY99075.1 subclass B1 metallo-beta-lactamase [Zhouia spongiae]
MKNLPFIILITLLCYGCKSNKHSYQSETLEIIQLTPKTFIHTSFLETDNYGIVPCNGLVFIDRGEAIVFDTPINNAISDELIFIIEEKLKAKIKAVVPTHFHEDCLGGLEAFHKKNITSYANQTTVSLLKNKSLAVPKVGFKDTIQFQIGKEAVLCHFFGEGHTKDNIVGYIPSEKTLFGGCLIKALNSGKGNLDDANIKEWTSTITNLKNSIQHIDHVVPGHGKSGDKNLLDYTANMFREYAPH